MIAGDRGGAGRAGRPHRHHRRRLDHRRRQGRADVPCQRHPHARGDRQAAPGQGRRRQLGPPPMKAPTVRQISVPTTLSGGEFSAIAGVTDERTKVKELLRHPRIMPSAVDPRSGGHRAHARMAVALDRHPRRRPLRRGHLLGRGQRLCRRAGAERAGAAVRAGCRASRPTRRTSRRGSIARWAHGCRWRRSPAACRWARATASAMCSAPCSTCRTGTPRASCCRPSCAGTSRPTRSARRWSPRPWAHAGKDAGDVLDAFIGGLGMPRSLGAVKIGREHFPRIAEQAMGTPWVPRNPRPIAGPARCARSWSLLPDGRGSQTRGAISSAQNRQDRTRWECGLADH